MVAFSSGSAHLDGFLGGGFYSDHINTIYGRSATGKTTWCLLSAISQIEAGKKVIFIDTEHGFSPERLGQLNSNNQNVMDKILLFHPNSFEEQMKCIKSAAALARSGSIGLVIVDTIGAHYRRELSINPKFVNKCMDIQLTILKNIAQSGRANILLTNQVYDSMETEEVQIVGGKMLLNWSRLVVELKKHRDGRREIWLRKHPAAAEKSVPFEIHNEGMSLIL